MKMLKMIIMLAIMAASVSLPAAACASAGGEVVVSAAASLANAFTQAGKEFEAANPDVKVLFNFAASGALLQQIAQGAPVDVFASADQETMDRAAGKGLVVVSSVACFAGNRLVLVAPKGSALKDVRELTGRTVKRIAVGKPETVPAGRYAREALERSGTYGPLEPKFIFAESVRQALDYVSRNEVDAGFVYATDAAAAASKVKVVCEVGGHRPVLYPVALVSGGKNPVAAKKFMNYLLSKKGQAVLARYGFTRP